MAEEIKSLRLFTELANSIVKNSKGERLQTALKRGLAEAKSKGGREKAIIFTESTRTQEYVRSILEEISRYKGKVVLFNGSNNDPKSKEIYQNWLKKHEGTDHITGSKTADMRAALVEYFRDEAIIMIATEAAAEGINLHTTAWTESKAQPVRRRSSAATPSGRPIDGKTPQSGDHHRRSKKSRCVVGEPASRRGPGREILMSAVTELAIAVGTSAACQVLWMPRASYYGQRRKAAAPAVASPRSSPARAPTRRNGKRSWLVYTKNVSRIVLQPLFMRRCSMKANISARFAPCIACSTSKARFASAAIS